MMDQLLPLANEWRSRTGGTVVGTNPRSKVDRYYNYSISAWYYLELLGDENILMRIVILYQAMSFMLYNICTSYCTFVGED
jgi:hypothetical protein